MTSASALKDVLSRTFLDNIDVRSVPMGLAVRSPFSDGSGDPVTFYVRETGDGYQLEDDGEFLSHLVASGVDIERGQRRQLLDSVLSTCGAIWDPETFEIRSLPISDVAAASVNFLAALIRVRDLELLTRETVRSTFRDDAIAAIEEQLGERFAIDRNSPLADAFSDNPADLVLSPKGAGRRLGVFLVNSPTPFLEAELLHSEIQRQGASDRFESVALIEDFPKVTAIGAKRYQRAVNRGLPMSFFRGDERASVQALANVASRMAA